MNIRANLSQFYSSFSFVGLATAAAFFSLSLTPSLLPRIYLVQGVLAGIAAAVGYAVGLAIEWLWDYLEIAKPRGSVSIGLQWLATVGALILAVTFSLRSTIWQNSIRSLMEMEAVDTAFPVRVALIALAVSVSLIISARCIRWIFTQINRRVRRVVPRRISNVLSTVIVGYLFIVMVNGVLARNVLKLADAFFLQVDTVTDEEIPQPENALASGSAVSLIPWETIGRKGKEFIVAEPSEEQLRQFAGHENVLRPLRIYVGLRSEETFEQRAELALEELKRIGGFDRSILVVATPTGTGWLDPGAVHTLEYLHGGDTAIVTMQYSYLPSWLTILVDPDRSRASAKILFNKIYSYWRTLPKEDRPAFYLHGLSLGALGSESCADLYTLFEDPIQGGLFSGPPFPSTKWAATTSSRNADSPAWLPTFRDGSMVRFTGQNNSLDDSGDRWGPMRFVYIQYASDPMSFFSPNLLFQKPAWLDDQRGPDVSPYLNWYPLVTFLQIGCDLPMATSVPSGHGHNIAPASYIDAWVAITDPDGWEPSDTERLKRVFRK